MEKNNNNDMSQKIRLDFLKPKLRENKLQLTDKKKINFGFNLYESVIDVEEGGFGISFEDDVLFTYGIETCCGLILYGANARILFHLDESITPEEVTEITDEINLSTDTTVIVIPGASCGIIGSFEYKKLEEEYRKKGFKVIEKRIPATFGFVVLETDKITIGTGLDRNLDSVLPIHRRRMPSTPYDYENNTIENLSDSESEIFGENNCNIGKSR